MGKSLLLKFPLTQATTQADRREACRGSKVGGTTFIDSAFFQKLSLMILHTRNRNDRLEKALIL